MKKIFAVLLTFSLLFTLPALAADGAVDVVMEGATYHLTLTRVEVADGKLTLTAEGFGETLRMGANGWMIAAWPVAHLGDITVRAKTFSATVGGPFTFIFECDEMPDEIWMDPLDKAQAEVLLWQTGDPVGGGDEQEVADELAGNWHGTGAPNGGGPSIDLTVRVEADGTGQYTFAQDGYTESYPFTADWTNSSFSVTIPADNQPGISSCEGNYTLSDGKLLLDIVTTFANGRVFSYTAECEKEEASDQAGT
ncbi:MAG TPA: hypothetical protein PKJ47_00685 [Candidatus Limiplasma sp.]|nr:hypothetical protein [Candidatus Limiplasma sp.]